MGAMRRTGLACVLAAIMLAGCTMVGPDFHTPDATVNAEWSADRESRITAEPGQYAEWWRTFDDPAPTQT